MSVDAAHSSRSARVIWCAFVVYCGRERSWSLKSSTRVHLCINKRSRSTRLSVYSDVYRDYMSNFVKLRGIRVRVRVRVQAQSESKGWLRFSLSVYLETPLFERLDHHLGHLAEEGGRDRSVHRVREREREVQGDESRAGTTWTCWLSGPF